MTSFKKIFTAPTFDDEIKTQQAYMLHIILWTLICVPIPFVIYALLLKSDNLGRVLLQASIAEIINVFLLFILRRGYVKAASIIQVSAFWFFFTVTAFTGNGVQSEAYLLGYGLAIGVAGILLGGTGALVFTALSITAGGWMVYGQMQARSNFGFDNSPLTTWMVSFVLFPVGAILQYLASRTTRTALSRARASEEKYRLISQVSSDYTFATEVHNDGSTSLSWVAGAFEKMTGYTYDEYVATGGWLAHVHPDDLEKDARDMEKLYKNQDIQSEIRTFTKNEGISWEQIFAHPIWDERENRLIRIIGAVRDITEQKQIESTLAYERDILQIFMDNMPDLVYFKDAESHFLRINQAQARFLGVDNPQEAIGKTDLDFQNPKLARELLMQEKQIIETGQPVWNNLEFNPTQDGEPRWLSTTKVPAKNELGQIIGTIGISRNITEQKKAEELEQSRRIMLENVIKLGKRVAEVNDINTTLEKIWHGIHDDLQFDRLAIFLYNAEHDSLDRALGTDKRGNMDKAPGVSFPIKEKSKLTQILSIPDGFYFTHNYDVENNIPEDSEMYGVKDFASLAVWAGEKPVAAICVDRLLTKLPITKLQLEALRLFAGYAGLAIENARLNSILEGELALRKEFIVELEAKNAELERFTYTVSHDLKSPLVTIRGFLGYLERDAQGGNFEKLKHDKQRIESAVGKMQNLLNDLLELSRIGRLVNPPVEVSFNEIVKDALEILHGQIEASHVLVDYTNNDIIVKCDRVRITEVLQNLIDNAIKFMGRQPEPRITIGTATNEKDETIFLVRDNGVGIDRQYHERIFTLFNKLNADTEGTGIGLTLIKRIIETHNGRIWLESEPGKGTTFYFTLP